MDSSHVYLAIIAGGQGTRLFPYSYPERPKQFCQLNAKNTFIQAVVENFAGIGVKRSHIVVITTDENQSALAKEQLVPRQILSHHIVQIPKDCGYVGAMLMATEFIYNLDKEAIVITTPSDQYISGLDDEFYLAIESAIAEAKQGRPVVVGVKVTDLDIVKGCGHAMTEEYVQPGQCARVVDFIEKPAEEAFAMQIMRSGNTACNTGINVWPAAYQHQRYDHSQYLSLSTDVFMRAMQPELMVSVGAFGWYDCGTLHSLYQVSKKTPNHNNVSLGGGNIDRYECRNSLFLCDPGYNLYASGCHGVSVIVVTIDNAPTIAVIDQKSSGRVKELAEKFQTYQPILTKTWSLDSEGNLVLPQNIKIRTCFVGVNGYAVLARRRDDDEIDVYVTRQREQAKI